MAIYEKQPDGGYKKISQIYAGRSAYDIACDNGFAGSEIEWLASLKTADSYIINVPTSGWSNSVPYSLTVFVVGIDPNDDIFWDINLDVSDNVATVDDAISAYNQIDKIDAGNNFVTLYSWSGVPLVPFSLKVVAIHATKA